MKKVYVLAGISIISPLLMAQVIQPTETVKGAAPEAINIQVENLTNPGADKVKIGEVLKGTYTFSDSDGDAETETLLQWGYEDNTPIPGSEGDTYTVTDGDVGHHIKLLVTPKTDSSVTEPDTGELFASEGIFVDEPYLPKDIIVPVNGAGWNSDIGTAGSAKACNDLGARVLTVAELQELFLTVTSAESIPANPPTREVCSLWGWPMSNMPNNPECRNYNSTSSAFEWYWSSEPKPASSHAYMVNMTTGEVSSSAIGIGRSLICKKL